MIRRLSLATLLSLVVAGAAAQDYPSRPVTFLIPQAPGGGTDLSIRMVEPVASRALGQKIVVINRAGTATLLQLTQAAPDGYTIGVASTGNTAAQPHNPGVPYERTDYVPIIQITNVPSILVAPAGSPFSSVADIVAAARKGQSIKVGTTALGTSSQLAGVLIERAFGIKFTYVPHKSNGEVMTSILGGHLDLGSVDLPSAGPRLSAVKGIGVYTDERLKELPDLPTMKEQGVSGTMGFYNIVIAPKGTPDRIVKVLHDAFKKAMEDPEVIEKARAAYIPLAYLGPQASREQINRQYDLMGTLLRELGLAKK
ncbi:MAG: Bug family tripartite tricarboxylate transporter substrate binding protein [Clostridia bacterium]